jgi:glucose-6-phosphate isomerase
MTLPFRHDLSAARPPAAFAALRAKAAAAAARQLAAPGRDAAPILALAEARDDLAGLRRRAEAIAGMSRSLVVLGTGGSSLGGQTLCALADRGFGPKPGRPAVRFFDNVDPDTLDLLAARLVPEETTLLIVSKSGGTVETLAQALALLPRFAGLSAAERQARVLVLTEIPDSPLGRLAAAQGFTLLPHEADLGGRFTALASVALLPAAVAGLDIAGIRAGGAAAMADLRRQGANAAAVEGAALAVAWMQAGASQQVLFPYCDRLGTFGFWYRQLWAESLGKEGLGQTPIRALGTVDQHSQLQLYLDGPRDKLFSLLRLETRGLGASLEPPVAGLDYLKGRRMGDLLEAEARATADTLAARGLPLRQFVLPRLDETALGALLQHFMLETILAGDLLGVSPFGQPAVEQGKVLARQYLREMGTP